MFCQNCGKSIPDGTSTCPYCGQITSSENQANNNEAKSKKVSGKKNTFAMVASIVALCAVAVLIWVFVINPSRYTPIYVLESDDEYNYEYDENGLCISMSNDVDTYTFEYEYDEQNRPLKRYSSLNGGDKILSSEYEYGDNGNLARLTIYDPEDSENFRTWEYDEKGRAVYCENYSDGLPVPLFANYANEDIWFEYDDNDRVTSWYQEVYASPEIYESLLPGITDEFGTEEQLLYTSEYVYEYDESGRVTSLTATDYHSRLGAYLQSLDIDDVAATYVTQLNFEYSKDKIIISGSDSTTYEDGSKEDIHNDIYYENILSYSDNGDTIASYINGSGNTVEIGDLNTDCDINSIELGYFGLRWVDDFWEYGVKTGTVAGFEMDFLFLQSYPFELRVHGTDNSGNNIEYILQPWKYGHRYLKLEDGRVVCWPGVDMDIMNSFALCIDEDQENMTYTVLQ